MTEGETHRSHPVDAHGDPLTFAVSGLLAETPGTVREYDVAGVAVDPGEELVLGEPVSGHVRLLRTNRYDVVITDYQLNWTDGLQILESVKRVHPDCPVVMFTGTGSDEVAVFAMQALAPRPFPPSRDSIRQGPSVGFCRAPVRHAIINTTGKEVFWSASTSAVFRMPSAQRSTLPCPK